MTQLTLHGRNVGTVFDLLGDKEDDITYSLGWALAQSERLTHSLLAELFPGDPGELVVIRLQEPALGAGRTDVEIESENAHLVIEAKRGWSLPERAQLEQYAGRFAAARSSAIAVVSECSPEFALSRLPDAVHGVPVVYRSWRGITELVATTAEGGGHAEKRLLRELVRYMKGLMTMQNATSNMVYVLSLSSKPLDWSDISFTDIVVERARYFHPVGGGPGGWPKEPPNYLGFRFDGRLQQIRHVEGYDVTTRPHDYIPEIHDYVDWAEHPHFLYRLGSPIEPGHRVSNGRVQRAQRTWAALDLLLTCETISDARDRTKQRLEAAGLS